MLNYEFPPLGGGAGNATYYLLKEFAKEKNIEIDLITSSTKEYREEQFSKNIKIYFLDIGKKGTFHYQKNSDLLKYSFKAYKLAKKLKEEKNYDLCHAFFGIPCGYIAMKLKIPYIVSLRGSDVPFYSKRFYLLDKFVFRRLSKKIWKKAKDVVALSRDLVSLARKTSKTQKISVVYNGINIEEFNDQNTKRNKNFNILFVGRLIERKGLRYVLEALNKLREDYPNLRLLVAGDGPLKESHEEYTLKNSLKDNVVFLGIINHNVMPKIYRKAQIFVLPSLNEALGNVTQEAMASGLPIITTKTGASEIVGQGGIIIRKESSKDIEKAIRKLIEDKRLRQLLSKENIKTAKRMSWRMCAKNYGRIYEKV